MSTKHTQGPWATWDCPVMQRIGVTGPTAAAAMTATADIRDKGYAKWSEVLTHGGCVAAIALGATQEEAYANARLIAAAPELLESLEEVLEQWISEMKDWGDDDYEDRVFVKFARETIAKAKGGAA